MRKGDMREGSGRQVSVTVPTFVVDCTETKGLEMSRSGRGRRWEVKGGPSV